MEKLQWNKIVVMITDPRQVLYFYGSDQSELAFKVTYSPNAFEGRGVFNVSKRVLIGEDQLGLLLQMLIDAQQYADGIFPQTKKNKGEVSA